MQSSILSIPKNYFFNKFTFQNKSRQVQGQQSGCKRVALGVQRFLHSGGS